MADIVILGAGLGGLPMAFEAREQMRKTDTITVISDSPTFHFTPLQPVGGGGLAGGRADQDRACAAFEKARH